MTDAATRDREAVEILKGNDRGRFSVPTKGLYPFQWNWDSAFAALGYSHIDPERAIVELETLGAAQWHDGMIPHIVFHTEDPGYFPGPNVWATGTEPLTSGITQPPVFMLAVAALVDRGHLSGPRLDPLLETAARWHKWFFAARRDPATNIIGVVHPWESGRDNMPDWDAALAAVNADNVQPFVRRDTGHVDAAMRPTEEQYKRYIALVEFGLSVGWDQERLMATSPFFVGDPGMAVILIRAERALARIAAAAGREDLAEAANARLPRLLSGLDAMWSEEVGAHTTYDVRTGKRGGAVSSASFLALGKDLVSSEQRERIEAHFDRQAKVCRYMAPSYDPASPEYDEKRYWRGPVWLVVNWLIATGLAEAGDAARAERLRADSEALVEAGAFHEYFSPETGAPLGGGAFTWTAAAWLDWVRG
ncbi:MGH1-like glycoside hydrolase domain-containing protein [Acuticoccus kandeliae]|uniref:MGH1-like glycoside hydrolase domain-containing protein n=1 Tax=Acuticoccus kandeliae TaxID=2073160 RepID=UPI000D3E81B2|nr:trehalase family glycosidase [Acuticoccus kandeliae]